jgi:hypothetical protein
MPNSLTPEETIDLLRHRMAVAGCDFDRVFQADTHKPLYNATNGVPRNLCSFAMHPSLTLSHPTSGM